MLHINLTLIEQYLMVPIDDPNITRLNASMYIYYVPLILVSLYILLMPTCLLSAGEIGRNVFIQL